MESQKSNRPEINYATRVDKVTFKAKLTHNLKAILTLVIAIIMLVPVFWMAATSLKTRADAVAAPPKVFFQPSLEGFIGLLTQRRQVTVAQGLDDLKADPNLKWYDKIMLRRGQQIVGSSEYVGYLKNSAITAGVSTVLSVLFGLFSAYAFSRFKVAGKGDLLFFILSTRMLPPVVVTIPIFLGKVGISRFRSGSNNPSASSKAFRRMNSWKSNPSPAIRMASTYNWYCPPAS